MAAFDHLVANEQDLRTIMGTPSARALLKEQKSLDEHTRAFIAQSPFLVLSLIHI